MITHPLQRAAYDKIAHALPVSLDPSKVAVEPGVSYARGPVKAHDYASGVMAAYGSLIELIGTMRGLPSQTMSLNRRLNGLHLNSGQLQYLNGYGTLMDTWPIGPDNGTYKAKDGRYVTIIGLHPHLRDALLDYFGCANTAAALQAAIGRKNAQDIEDELAARKLPCGIMRSPEEWLAHPQGEATAKRPLIDIERHGAEKRRVLGGAKKRPLEGVRVVEIANLVAGPTIARVLAEQGADVIKVQAPVSDITYPLMLDVSWGKRNMLLDVKSRFGKARFADLIAGADVLVSSQRPGALAEMGFSDEALKALNPNLVVGSVSFAPPGTPWGERRGFEQVAQSVSGMMHLTSEGMPSVTMVSVLINDYLTGYLGGIGVLAALAARETEGGFWKVNASLVRCGTMGASLVAPRHGEPYEPVTLRDMMDFAIDQETPQGTYTRLDFPVSFSRTPSFFACGPALPGTTRDIASWMEPGEMPDEPQHTKSHLVRGGLLRSFISSHGIEDRGDGGGELSLASHSLMKLAMALRA